MFAGRQMPPKKPGPKARRCAICEKARRKCGKDKTCMKVIARLGEALPAAGASASGGASHSKRERKQVQRFEPEGKVWADYNRQGRIRKLKDATFAPSKKNRSEEVEK